MIMSCMSAHMSCLWFALNLFKCRLGSLNMFGHEHLRVINGSNHTLLIENISDSSRNSSKQTIRNTETLSNLTANITAQPELQWIRCRKSFMRLNVIRTDANHYTRATSTTISVCVCVCVCVCTFSIKRIELCHIVSERTCFFGAYSRIVLNQSMSTPMRQKNKMDHEKFILNARLYLWVEENDNIGFASEIRENNVFAILVWDGEIRSNIAYFYLWIYVVSDNHETIRLRITSAQIPIRIWR